VSCAVLNIGEVVGPGKQLSITQEMTSINDFNGDKTKTFLDYTRNDSYNVIHSDILNCA
jgi:hypothetical protein